MGHSFALLSILVAIASAWPAAQQPPRLFTFHSNAWLNLHHYVRSTLPPQL